MTYGRTTIAICMLLAVATGAEAKKRPPLREQIAAFTGQPLSAATDKLGLPAGRMEMAGNTVYSWHKGNVFTGYGDDEKPLECTIRLSVDASGTIRTGDVEGNRGACDIFSKQLG